MVVPCMVKTWLYALPTSRVLPGRISWVRISMANPMATTKKQSAVPM